MKKDSIHMLHTHESHLVKYNTNWYFRKLMNAICQYFAHRALKSLIWTQSVSCRKQMFYDEHQKHSSAVFVAKQDSIILSIFDYQHVKKSLCPPIPMWRGLTEQNLKHYCYPSIISPLLLLYEISRRRVSGSMLLTLRLSSLKFKNKA